MLGACVWVITQLVVTDESYGQLAMETLEELDWCLDRSTLEINLLVATSVGRHSTSCSTLTPTWWSIPARNHSAARSAARPSFRTKTENSIWKPTALRAWRYYKAWSSLTPPPTQTRILKPHMIQHQTTLMLHQTMRIKRSSNAPPPYVAFKDLIWYSFWWLSFWTLQHLLLLSPPSNP